MSSADEIVSTRSARRALEVTLPESVAAAAFEFIVGPLAGTPADWARPCANRSRRSTPRGAASIRVIYRSEDTRLIVQIVTIAHRRNAYQGH